MFSETERASVLDNRNSGGYPKKSEREWLHGPARHPSRSESVLAGLSPVPLFFRLRPRPALKLKGARCRFQELCVFSFSLSLKDAHSICLTHSCPQHFSAMCLVCRPWQRSAACSHANPSRFCLKLPKMFVHRIWSLLPLYRQTLRPKR